MFNLLIQPNIQGCENDQLTISDVPILSVYYIDDPSLEIPATVTQSTNVGCPVQCFLTQGNNDVGVYDTSLFAFDCATYTLTVSTSEQSFDQLSASLELKVTSVLSLSSQKSDTAQFVIEVKNKCRAVALEPAIWFDTEVEFDFRTSLMNFIGFDRASFTADPTCDDFGITYSLVDENNVPVNPAFYTIFEDEPPKVRVLAP